MGSIEYEIKKIYKNLRPSEQKVADFILAYKGKPEELTIVEMAEGAKVSQPTIIRFANSMHLKGFKELKYLMVQDDLQKNMQANNSERLHGFFISANDRIEDMPDKVIQTTIHMLRDVLNNISIDEFTRLIYAIISARRVLVFGSENSGCTVNDLVTKLLYLGIDCRTYTDSYLQSVCANNLTMEDLAIGVSYTGCSKDTVDVLKIAKEAGAVTAAITNFSKAKISEFADINIAATAEQYFYGDKIFSRTSQIAIVDMIYTGVLVSNFHNFTANLDKNMNAILDRDYIEKNK